jgi:hypothetical protein
VTREISDIYNNLQLTILIKHKQEEEEEEQEALFNGAKTGKLNSLLFLQQ